jgi:Na+/H+-dicarboxylate symporter
MESIEKFREVGVRAILYYTSTTALAVLTGLFVVTIFRPGQGISLLPEGSFEVKEVAFSLEELLISLIPENIFKALSDFEVLPVIVATILFSLSVLAVDWKKKLVLHELIGELDVVLMKLTSWIIKFAPIGVCALIAGKVASLGGFAALKPILFSLGKYVLTVISGLLFHALVTLSLLYFLLTRKNPYSLLLKAREALITAFATASSSATLPVTLAVAVSSGIKKRVAQFTLPLGATINMDGTALYEAVAAVFLAQAYGLELSIFQYGVIFLTATLAAIGAAGIPEAGLVTMVLVLESVGIPTEGIGIILAVDWFLDRCRTAVNILGDIIGAAIISASLGEKR